jgi:hypothetical protein
MVSIHCPPGYEPGACRVLVVILEILRLIFNLRFRCATQLVIHALGTVTRNIYFSQTMPLTKICRIHLIKVTDLLTSAFDTARSQTRLPDPKESRNRPHNLIR